MAAATKFPVSLDPDLLDRAREVLGTTTKADTIRGALSKVVADALRAEEIEFLRAGGYAAQMSPAEVDKVRHAYRDKFPAGTFDDDAAATG